MREHDTNRKLTINFLRILHEEKWIIIKVTDELHARSEDMRNIRTTFSGSNATYSTLG